MPAMLTGLLGGGLIGLAAALYWFATGRVAGVSGILAGALRERQARNERLAFLAGLVAAGLVAALLSSPASAYASPTPIPVLVVAGALVGFGTRLGGGCTSGHGVCGVVARLAVVARRDRDVHCHRRRDRRDRRPLLRRGGRAVSGRVIATAAAGVLFGAGLVVSGMTDPRKVIGFLDFAGRWNPQLIAVMAGAIVVYASLLALIPGAAAAPACYRRAATVSTGRCWRAPRSSASAGGCRATAPGRRLRRSASARARRSYSSRR